MGKKVKPNLRIEKVKLKDTPALSPLWARLWQLLLRDHRDKADKEIA